MKREDKSIGREMLRFNYTVGEIDALYHRAAVKLGLSDSAMAVLYTLQAEGGSCPITNICKLTGTGKQTVNSALRKLEREGIIVLEAAEGRQKRVSLTPEGVILAKSTVKKVTEAENRVFGSWSKEERSEYLRLTQRFLSAFKKEVEQMEKEEI